MIEGTLSERSVMSGNFVRFLLALVFLQTASCQTGGPGTMLTGPPGAQARVSNGTWGGDHAGMEVTDDGATLDYDCAHGTIDEPLLLDGQGDFNVTGTHVTEHGGLQPGDGKADSHPARYTGHVEGQVMTLTVTLTDTQEEFGTFKLTFGASPRVVKCL